MLSGDVKYLELLKRSYPKIKQHSYEIGKKTYENMFAENNEIKNLFKNTPPKQSQRLVDTIILFCEGVDSFSKIYDQLDNIAHIHIKHAVKNEYYSIMKKAFVKALCDTFKIDKSDDLIQAWIYGFNCLSQELIHIENLIRKYSKQNFFPEKYSEYAEY